MSLQSRLKNLQENGEKWKEKVEKKITIETSLKTLKQNLESSQTNWTRRVTKKDQTNFTVEGKLRKDEVEITQTEKIEEKIEKKNYIKSEQFIPNDYETFGSFFEPLKITETEVELTVLGREKILNEKFEKPKRTINKKQKKTIESKVKEALESSVSFDVILKPVNIIQTPPKCFKIKGKKHPIPLLIDLEKENLNRGDSFVLITDQKVYCYYGDYTNLREKAKADEFFYHFLKRRECVKVYYNGTNWEEFLDYFHGDGVSEEGLGEESDSCYEDCLSFCVYRWDTCFVRLVDVTFLSLELLESEELLLFDFGKEVYLYYGNAQEPTLKEAEEIVHKNFKYVIFKKIRKNLEPIEFIAKFRGIKKKNNKISPENPEKFPELTFCPHITKVKDEVVLSNVKFGSDFVVAMEEDPRTTTFTTQSLTKQKISATIQSHPLLQFHTQDCYIIKWTYNLTYQTHKLDKVTPSTTTHGRTRVCYFFWYGKNCSVLDRGRIGTIYQQNAIEKNSDVVAMEEGEECGLFRRLLSEARFFGVEGEESVGWDQERVRHDALDSSEKIDKIIKFKFDGSILKLEEIELFIVRNFSHLIIGTKNRLILKEENYNNKRFIVKCVYENFQDVFYGGEDLKNIYNFIQEVEDNSKKLEKQDIQLFSIFFPPTKLKNHLSNNLLRSLNHTSHSFSELSQWKQTQLTSQLFNSSFLLSSSGESDTMTGTTQTTHE